MLQKRLKTLQDEYSGVVWTFIRRHPHGILPQSQPRDRLDLVSATSSSPAPFGGSALPLYQMEAENDSLLPTPNADAQASVPGYRVASRTVSRHRQNEPEADRRNRGQKLLTERHIGIVAVAGMMGTGIFLTSGRSLADAGPGGALLGYFLVEPLHLFARSTGSLITKTSVNDCAMTR